MERFNCSCSWCHDTTGSSSTNNIDNGRPSKTVETTSNLVDHVIQQFSLRRVFNDHQSTITSIDWDVNGECFLSCCRDNSVTIHSLSRNTVRHLYSRKYGAESGKFVRGGPTHCIVSAKPPEGTNATCASVVAAIDGVHQRRIPRMSSSQSKNGRASTSSQVTPQQLSGALRHWDLVENRFIKTFVLASPFASNGTLSVSDPPTNLIMSPCLDGIVRIFTLDKDGPLATIESNVKGPLGGPQAIVSRSGNIAAVQIKPFVISLFDFKHGWMNSDYLTINIEEVMPISKLVGSNSKDADYSKQLEITSLLFDPVPRSLLVTLTDLYRKNYILQFSTLTGRLINTFRPLDHDSGDIVSWDNFVNVCIPDISGDGRYVACGNLNNCLAIWSCKTGQLVTKIDCSPKLAQHVKWNPSACLIASARDHIAFWGY